MPGGGCKSYQSTTQKAERGFWHWVGVYSLRTNVFRDELVDATRGTDPETGFIRN